MKKTTWMAVAIVLTTAGFAGSLNAQETVASITEKFETEKAAALENYITNNAEAEDIVDGQMALLDSYMTLGKSDKVPPLVDSLYEGPGKENPQVLFQMLIGPMMEVTKETGDIERMQEFLGKIRKDFADHQAAGQINQALDQIDQQLMAEAKALKAGDTMDIAFTSMTGEEIDLKKMEGKVVLVDFWATWCGPCVAEMPTVISAYEKFNDKGFEVVGISLDQDKAAVEKFIADNKMPWTQYFDGKGWQNEIAGKFGINSIPATFLIGKDGKIAATNLRGPALEAALEKELAK